MAIDKSLYTAPAGLASLDEGEMDLEIEIVDPEAVNIKTDGLEIALLPEPTTAETFNANLADFMDEGAIAQLAGDIEDDVVNDKSSRKEWEKAYVEGLKLLGLQIEERTEPWNGACGVFHPMITEAVVRFQAETITETFPAQGPVRTKIIGKDTPEIQEAASRVEEDMNFQLTEVMTEYRPEHERMLWSLPATGSAFKKVYYDPNLGRQVAMFIPAEDILLPYGATDLDTCHRVTHVMRKTKNEIIKLQQGGFYVDIELPDPPRIEDDIKKAKDKETGFQNLNDDRYVLLECHVDLNLKGFEDKDDDKEETGIALPYVVTLIKGTNTVLAIRRNWLEDDPLRLKRQHFVHYQYVPGFGAYGFGLFHLIGGFAKNATSLMRQLTDAGTLSNLPGGLKSRGLRIKGDDTPIAPGEWRDVDVASGNIRDSILPLPYKEPSQVLFALFQNIVQEGRQFASAGDMKVSDMSAQAPVGTTLAILERTLKVMGAVQARMHYSMRQEFRLLKAIIADYTPEEYDYDPIDGSRKAKKADYDMVAVIPVSDPNAATMAQKIVQYQAALQLAQTAPQLYNLPLLHRQMIEVLGIKNAAKLVPVEDDARPIDPVQENQNALTGTPNKAWLEQDHQAHIATHMSAMQNPKIAAIIGQNPQAQAMQAAMMAHISEHIGFEYRKQVEQQLGAVLPTEEQNKNLPPEVAAQIAQAVAKASQALLQRDQQEAQQQQAQQQMQDPVLQMQMQELQLKMKELELQAQKQQIEAADKADRIRIEEARIEAQKEIAAMQVGATAAAAKDKLSKQMQLEGMKLGIDVAKSRDQQTRQAQQRPQPNQRKEK